MKRLTLTPRPDWQRIVSQEGLIYHTPGGHPYWDESAAYSFSVAEVDVIETATAELQDRCLEAGQYIIDNRRWSDLRIPPAAVDAIVHAWNDEPPSLYGRMDLAYDGSGPPKLMEYNADTPTALLEAAVIQWTWHEQVRPAADQFNSIHDKLIAKWQDLKAYMPGGVVHFVHADDLEDGMTVSYLRDTAQSAGLQTVGLLADDLGWNGTAREWRDLDNAPIRNLFALYPWEWLLAEFPDAILATARQVNWIEPIWKMLWSNKGLLAILWEMFPDHPNLLPAYFDVHGMEEYVRKPLLSREGANVLVHTRSGDESRGGPYDGNGYVYQALAPLPDFGGNTPALGSWLITGQGPAGIGIRESTESRITDNLSRFVPHCIE